LCVVDEQTTGSELVASAALADEPLTSGSQNATATVQIFQDAIKPESLMVAIWAGALEASFVTSARCARMFCSKPETRSTKSETNSKKPKSQMTETAGLRSIPSFGHLYLVFVSSFEFRAFLFGFGGIPLSCDDKKM
jgi:hypothetical protein